MALNAPVHWTMNRIGLRRPYCSCNSGAVHGSPYRQRIALVIEQKNPYDPVIYGAPIAGIEFLSPFSDGVGMRRRHVCEGLDSLKALASIAGWTDRFILLMQVIISCLQRQWSIYEGHRPKSV
jgi:hypothetical protein